MMIKNKRGVESKMLWVPVSIVLILLVAGTLLYIYMKAYNPFSEQTSETLSVATKRLCPLGQEIGIISGQKQDEYKCNPCLGSTSDIDEDSDGLVAECDEDDKNPRKVGCKKNIAHNKNDKYQCCVEEGTYGYIECVT